MRFRLRQNEANELAKDPHETWLHFQHLCREGKLSVTSRKSFATALLTTAKRCQYLKVAATWESNTNFPTVTVITIGNELVRFPDVLFQPNVIGMESHDVHRLTFDSIMKCDVDIPEDL